MMRMFVDGYGLLVIDSCELLVMVVGCWWWLLGAGWWRVVGDCEWLWI